VIPGDGFFYNCKKYTKTNRRIFAKSHKIIKRIHNLLTFRGGMWYTLYNSCQMKQKKGALCMFEKGEYVVYGSKGVCRIQEISHVDIPGVDQKRLYYIMHPVQNSGQTLYLPTDSTKAVIRRVMTKEEANRLIHDIPSIKKLEVPNEKQREASYKQALQGCSGRDWISILKTLNQRKEERLAAGKKITALDERYLRVTEQELYGELSVVLGIEKENMHDYIQEQIAAL
jgi:CarD family transcriptional regulator